MSINDPLASVLSHIFSCDKVGKPEVILTPASKLIKAVLDILKANGYVGDYEITDERRGGYLKLQLLGNINRCGVIKPRFSFTKKNHEEMEKRYLPAKDFGVLIVSTPKGIMIHNEALEKKEGGKLIAYCY
jgi:small subunit ribosomal protein S8